MLALDLHEGLALVLSIFMRLVAAMYNRVQLSTLTARGNGERNAGSTLATKAASCSEESAQPGLRVLCGLLARGGGSQSSPSSSTGTTASKGPTIQSAVPLACFGDM